MELVEFINKIVSLAQPNIHTIGKLEYADKNLQLIAPPMPGTVACSTLQGLVDLYDNDLDGAEESKDGDLFAQIVDPTTVDLISSTSDEYGRRRVWARASYPDDCKTFAFGTWLNPENFIIAVQQSFQRIKLESDAGEFLKDLDYVLGIASKIGSEQAQSHEDDGIAQRVTVRQGITLKSETTLRPIVFLAPYRTFPEIDQVLSQFVFRARFAADAVHLALFEGDGGRWRLGAATAIKAWLAPKLGPKVPVIS